MIRLVRPKKLSAADLIYPIFIREDEKSFDIPSMRGQRYLSLDDAVGVCKRTADVGVPGVMIFAILEERNADGTVALGKDNFNLTVFRKLKKELGEELVLISNICLCTYTEDEFCVYSEHGKVLNEKTSKMLGKIALAHAEAGADVVAPAAMADGQVRRMRSALDEGGFEDVPIMSYIKTDSCLFQPFFKTMSSRTAPRAGVDTSKFRADIINDKMFMQKMDLDIGEGADMVIVKPALTNLDLILLTGQRYPTVPIAAYQVSGEYVMIESAVEGGLLDEEAVLMETLNSIKRAGADMILTYHALQAATLLK